MTKRIKHIEDYQNGTEIVLCDKLNNSMLTNILISEEFYKRHSKTFNKARNPVKDLVTAGSFIVNTLNGKYNTYNETSILNDALGKQKRYDIFSITEEKPVKIFTGDIVVFQQYNSIRTFTRKFVNNVTDYAEELGINEHGLSSVVGNYPYKGKFFEWNKEVFFIVDIQQTKWNKFKNQLINLFKL